MFTFFLLQKVNMPVCIFSFCIISLLSSCGNLEKHVISPVFFPKKLAVSLNKQATFCASGKYSASLEPQWPWALKTYKDWETQEQNPQHLESPQIFRSASTNNDWRNRNAALLPVLTPGHRSSVNRQPGFIVTNIVICIPRLCLPSNHRPWV